MRTIGPGHALISRLHASFRKEFARLPRNVQKHAKKAYRQFQADPAHPGLQFKRLNSNLPMWSVRVSDSHRAVGVPWACEKGTQRLCGSSSEHTPITTNCLPICRSRGFAPAPSRTPELFSTGSKFLATGSTIWRKREKISIPVDLLFVITLAYALLSAPKAREVIWFVAALCFHEATFLLIRSSLLNVTPPL
jgi:hypothetical protein